MSAVVRPQSLTASAVRLSFSRGVVLTSDETWSELLAVLKRKKFDRYGGRQFWLEYLLTLQLQMESISVAANVHACRDPKDNKFLELALDGRADVILTGDRDLLALHPFRDIDILTPVQFLERAGR